eukprot:TRINITY_DN1087_c0_g1_i1.p2 TRINITY_DN1087_c0_g1~~TRINITY_DN1087_c0_g1_i1.p2  ORF type:complete len:158 (+),score=34.29 TRINITY_DN1087_c0_g1_i1:73-546(+)
MCIRDRQMVCGCIVDIFWLNYALSILMTSTLELESRQILVPELLKDQTFEEDAIQRYEATEAKAREVAEKEDGLILGEKYGELIDKCKSVLNDLSHSFMEDLNCLEDKQYLREALKLQSELYIKLSYALLRAEKYIELYEVCTNVRVEFRIDFGEQS